MSGKSSKPKGKCKNQVVQAKKDRVGLIIIATAVVESSWKELIDTIGSRFWPVAVHVSPDGSRRAYVGLCDDFDEIGLDEKPPQYIVQVDINPRGGKSVKFTRAPLKTEVAKEKVEA